MPTAYGHFYDFCSDSTLPVCNLFNYSPAKNGPGYTQFHSGCELRGFTTSGGYVRNIGSIILAFFAILSTFFLLWRTERKRAAVGRREMQLFLIGYIIIEICEIFTVGGFPLDEDKVIAFTGIHLGAIIATSWILMLNGAVGFQAVEDGNILSMSLVILSAAALFIGTGYIALDTGYSWSGYWDSSLTYPNRSYSLYTLYLLCPLVFLSIFFVLETYLVVKVLKETRPMLWLILAVLSFAVGQIFQFLISVHICHGSNGKVDGALFETFFTLVGVILVWVFWSSITEDDWPQQLDSTASANNVPPQQDMSYVSESQSYRTHSH